MMAHLWGNRKWLGYLRSPLSYGFSVSNSDTHKEVCSRETKLDLAEICTLDFDHEPSKSRGSRGNKGA